MSNPLVMARRRALAVDRHWQSQTLSTRLTTAAAFAAMFAIVAVVAVAYIAVRHELTSNIDSQLRKQISELSETPAVQNGLPIVSVTTSVGDVGGYAETVNSAGEANPASGQAITLKVTEADRQIASHGGTAYYDEYENGLHLRVIARPLAQTSGVAVLIALPLTAVDSQLHKLRIAFMFLILFGLLLVIAATWFVVRRTMRPVASLTEAAERISVTSDLTTRIEDYGDDELGRLASTFNTMLDALERSLGQQRQLILDASHELRTPLASLRTNVEVLHDVDRLSADQRRSLLDGIVTQLDELTGLVADVVELARGDAPESAQEELSLDDLVVHAVARARRHWPNIVFMLETEPVVVRGVPGRLDRAVANLLDNAGKFSPAGSVVDVALTSEGVLTVADRGPGVPEEALEQVFDRFYRADEARALPGSGLGLAIVKQVMDGHRGTVALSNRPDGGAIVTATLPPVTAAPDDDVPMIEAHVEAQPVG